METNNLLAPLFFVLIGLMGGAILKFGFTTVQRNFLRHDLN